MKAFDFIEKVVCGALIAAIVLALLYVAVEQITYVGARGIRAITPALPEQYRVKAKHLADLRLDRGQCELDATTEARQLAAAND